MSYHRKPSHALVRRPAPMGDIATFVEGLFGGPLLVASIWGGEKVAAAIGGPSISYCLAQAHAQSANLDAKTADLAANWNPTGFFTPTQVDQLIAATSDVVAQAKTNLAGEMNNTNTSATVSILQSFVDDCNRKLSEGAKFTSAAQQARAAGAGVVDAPGLKTWVLQTMNAASSSFDAVSVVACAKPTWFVAVSAMIVAFNKVVSIAKAILGVVANIGDTVIKVSDDLTQIWTVVKWGGLAALGVAAIYKLKQMRDGK